MKRSDRLRVPGESYYAGQMADSVAMGDLAELYVIDDIPIFSGVPAESMGVHDALVFKWSWRAAKRDTKYAE
jgi:hypothetical protein